MKKIGLIIVSLLLVITLSGCAKDSDHDTSFRMKVSEGIKNIEINNEKVFANLDIINDNTLETRMGINKNFVNNYAIVVSLYSYSDIVAVIKKDNKYVDNAILAVNLYIEGAQEQYKNSDDEYSKEMLNKFNNALKEEYKGYQIIIVSNDNAKVFEEVKKLVK